MKTKFISEPELEFGSGRHIDIKFGLMNYGPFDFANPLAPKKIKLGIVGTPETIDGLLNWIARCRTGIAAKSSKRPNLFPRFPGFGDEAKLAADFIIDDQLLRSIPQNRLDLLCNRPRTDDTLKEIANLYIDELEYLTQKTMVDVLICAYPFVLVKYIDEGDEIPDADIGSDENPNNTLDRSNPSRINLHDYLKAEAMHLKKPIQIIRPATYDENKRLKRKDLSGKTKQLQDEATRAWNLYVALYYKAGGIPWRLLRNPSELSTCYVGISFYKTIDESKLLTSTAQVFNERGEGMILRGGMASISKNDRQIHLSKEDSYSLLRNALTIYRREHKNFPARVVVHKSSLHSPEEKQGFIEALNEFSIEVEQADFMSITRSFTRLFRGNIYPPLRGTFLETEENFNILYTKGSVDFFSAYPGMYVPLPLAFRSDMVSETPIFLAREIMALTKMNWNNTQFDGGEPITLRAARQVGNILKYLDTDYEPYYRYYM